MRKITPCRPKRKPTVKYVLDGHELRCIYKIMRERDKLSDEDYRRDEAKREALHAKASKSERNFLSTLSTIGIIIAVIASAYAIVKYLEFRQNTPTSQPNAPSSHISP